jgi:antitoxin (DNA-binding transcriptional repressor) of toxin-antitoxin stability system
VQKEYVFLSTELKYQNEVQRRKYKMTKTVTFNEAKTQLQKLLAFTKNGNEIIITQDNIPLARLVPIHSKNKSRIAGLSEGKISAGDDFDEPLPDDFWLDV